MRLKKDRNNSIFHSFEIAFCGYSKSGKTSLISKLVKELRSEFDIGYLKHDAHKFEVDHPGKDTHTISSCGAKVVLINDSNHFAKIDYSELEQIDVRSAVVDTDFLFIEGHKHSQLPKFIVIANDANREKIINEISNGSITDVVAIISESDIDPLEGQFPFFQRDETLQIKAFILEHFSKLIPSTINGLILTGGKSERMNLDKGAIEYHQGISQIEYTKNLLSPYCNDIYISCREDQSELDFLQGHNLLFDSFPSVGPSTGILSAQFFDQSSAWIVIACDLPYLEKDTIAQLIQSRNPFKLATCFLNPKKNWPEPLCAIYEPKSYLKLMQYFAQNRPCPRKVLFNSNIQSLTLTNQNALENVNTPIESELAIKHINSNGEIYAN